MNIRGFGNRLNYYSVVVSSTSRITIASLGLAFCILASSCYENSYRGVH